MFLCTFGKNHEMKEFLFLVVFTVLVACGVDYGSHVQSDKVTVYYTKGVEKSLAKEVLSYWENEGFTSTNHQYLQLTTSESIFQLKIIPSDTSFLTSLPFYLIEPLQTLEEELKDKLFKEVQFELVLTDNQFRQSVKITD
jgi:ribosomal protein S25